MFMCPAYKRPHRLFELAQSWEQMCPETPLHVRIWKDDPKRGVYENIEWPRSWELYLSDKESAGAAIQEFADNHVGEPIGFIGEDVVLRSFEPIRALEEAADLWFLAYPNDTIQRNGLATHFCAGPKFIEWIGGRLAPGRFPHHYLDMRLTVLAMATGLTRYCPNVIFYHKHPFAQRCEMDEVYLETQEQYAAATKRWEQYRAQDFKPEVRRVREAMHAEFERGIE